VLLPPVQEEEQMAVRDHLQTTVAATSRYAQASADKVTIPSIRFIEVWNATDGFNKECAAASCFPSCGC
jgi:hypothetical protein